MLVFLDGDYAQTRHLCLWSYEWGETKQLFSLPPRTDGHCHTDYPTNVISRKPQAARQLSAVLPLRLRTGRIDIMPSTPPHLRRFDQPHPSHGCHAGTIIILLAEVVFPKRPQRDRSGKTQRAEPPRRAEQCVGGLQRCYYDHHRRLSACYSTRADIPPPTSTRCYLHVLFTAPSCSSDYFWRCGDVRRCTSYREPARATLGSSLR